jgi:enamine deaminase RidA (YjgF/YER057c/UK114 family)
MLKERRPTPAICARNSIRPWITSTVLTAAGFRFANVVRLNYYTTNVDELFANWDVIVNRLARAGCTPASTLLGVSRLAFPELLIEIEATAVK